MIEKTTLFDVSKAANVSLNTAAKVLAGQAKKARISEKTAKKIKKIATELGYVPNMMARNLRSKHNRIIGVFIADMADSAYTLSSRIILKQLHAKGFSPFLTVAEIGLDLCKQEWLQNRIEGLILCGTTQEMSQDFFNELNKSNIATVIAGCAFKEPGKSILESSEVSSVSMNNYTGMQLAIFHLIKQNRKKIAYIDGPQWHADACERREAYENIIKDHYDPTVISPKTIEPSWKAGYDGTAKLRSISHNYDAIIAYDDRIAIGSMKWLWEHGKKIPQDIAVVGFDNSPESQSCTPSLTTIDQPLDIIGQKSVTILENRLYSNNPIEKIQITPSLVIRRSSLLE